MAKHLCLLAFALTAVSSPSHAAEIFGGLYLHDINTPWTRAGPEGGINVQLGLRGRRIGRTPLQPYGLLAINTSGDTHYGAIGMSAKFSDRLFIRPGIGIAIHTGSTAERFNPDNDDIEFGSRFLFEPELGVGARLNERLSIEASWIHMSHAQLFSRQNSGVQNLGIRMTLKLP